MNADAGLAETSDTGGGDALAPNPNVIIAFAIGSDIVDAVAGNADGDYRLAQYALVFLAKP